MVFILSDKISNPTKWQITESLVIEPYSYQLIYLSGRNQMSANGQYGSAPTQILNYLKQEAMSILF